MRLTVSGGLVLTDRRQMSDHRDRYVPGSQSNLSSGATSFDDLRRVEHTVEQQLLADAKHVEIQLRWRKTRIVPPVLHVNPPASSVRPTFPSVGQSTPSESQQQEVVRPFPEVEVKAVAQEP
jgi:hypothetical protein